MAKIETVKAEGSIDVKSKYTPIDNVFEYPVAFNVGIVGIGQAGNNIADSFYSRGYRRVLAVNTATVDLSRINQGIHRMDFGTGGGGKRPEVTAKLAEENYRAICEALPNTLGSDLDYVFIVAGMGCGTGQGMSPTFVKAAREYAVKIGMPPENVGVIITLPTLAEGQRICQNALQGFADMCKLVGKKSPIIVVDNNRYQSIFEKEPSIRQHFKEINKLLTLIFHSFNQMAVENPIMAAFDKKDCENIFNNGILSLCGFSVATGPAENLQPEDISGAIRDNANVKLFADVDFKTGNAAGCLFLLNDDACDHLAMSHLEKGFDEVNNLMSPQSVLHRGVYDNPEQEDTVFCYLAISGVDPPVNCLRELSVAAGTSFDEEMIRQLFS